VFRFHEPDGTLKAHYANITMPPTFTNGVIDYVDLDIDVVAWPDGRVDVLDRDDFEKNKVTYGYSDEVIGSAETAVTELLEIVERREFPFLNSTQQFEI
jgi:hypothetical protein